MTDYDVLIVGSGPSALAAIRQLPHGLRVLVLDRGHTIPNSVLDIQNKYRNAQRFNLEKENGRARNFSSGNSKNNYRLKSYWGSEFSYLTNESAPPYESKSQGGFTSVWGATCFPPTRKVLNNLDSVTFAEYSAALSEIETLIDVSWGGSNTNCYEPCNTQNHLLCEGSMFGGNLAASGEKLTSNGGHIYWEVTRLAVSVLNQRKQKSPGDGCLNCGQCQNGCPFGVVWNSWFDFKVEVLRLGATYLRANLISAKDLGEFVQVDYQEAEMISSVMIKRVFLTGGPLSTSKILLRSGIVDSLHLVDSQTSMIMGISLRKKLLMRQHNNVSFPDTSFLYINEGNELALQSYSFSPYILSRLLPPPLATSKLSQIILKVLQKFLFVGLLYFDSSISGRLELDSSGRSISIKGNDFLQKKIAKNFMYDMKKLGLFFIPKLISLPIGGGYHFMGKFFPSNYWINEKTLEDQGMTKLSRLATFQGAERIHLLDSSILGHLPTGSVTLSSMATTTTLVKRILKANPLHNLGIQ